MLIRTDQVALKRTLVNFCATLGTLALDAPCCLPPSTYPASSTAQPLQNGAFNQHPRLRFLSFIFHCPTAIRGSETLSLFPHDLSASSNASSSLVAFIGEAHFETLDIKNTRRHFLSSFNKVDDIASLLSVAGNLSLSAAHAVSP